MPIIRKELSMRYMKDHGGNTCRNHLKGTNRLMQWYLPRHADLDNILKII